MNVPGAQTQALETSENMTIAAAGTTSTSIEVGNPTDLGLIVGTLDPAATLTVQVSQDNVAWRGVVTSAGAATLVLASGAGAVAVDSNAMGAVLGYKWIRVVAGGAQTSGATITLTRKISRTDPTV